MLNYNSSDTLNNSTIINYLVYDLCTHSSPENGLCFSNNAFTLMNKIKEFNYKHIYFSDKIQNSVSYFELVLTLIYDKLKSCFSFENTLDNLKALALSYPKLANGFYHFLQNYCDFSDRHELKLNNKIIFNISEANSYYNAILSYISGMTDNFAIELYNEIIRF